MVSPQFGHQIDGGPPSLALGHSAYDHQGEAGRYGDRHFDFDR
jgi:hypothetical protein